MVDYITKLINQFWSSILKSNEFNNDALSNAVAQFFHIFVIVLLVEYEKSRRMSVAIKFITF